MSKVWVCAHTPTHTHPLHTERKFFSLAQKPLRRTYQDSTYSPSPVAFSPLKTVQFTVIWNCYHYQQLTWCFCSVSLVENSWLH